MSPVKVLFVEYCDYLGFPVGGQLSFIRALLAGVDVDAYLAGVTNGQEPLLHWTTKDVAGRNRRFFAFDRFSAVRTKPRIPQRIRLLINVVKTKKRLLACKPDVVYAQSPEAALPFLIGNKKTPTVFGLAGANNPLKYSRFKWARLLLLQKFYEEFLLKPVIRRASNVIAIDEDCALLCARMRGDLPPNWIKIPIAIDTKIFRPQDKKAAREEIGHSYDYPIITCVGRLSNVKGYDFAFDVIQGMLRNRDIRLFMVGDGEDREFLEEDAVRRGIAEKVVFWGSVSHDKLPSILNASDIFFMPSLAEGVPNALLEAMACGLPVVASAVGGIPEIIEDEVNGILLHDRDVESASAKLAAVLDKHNDFAARAIQTIEDRFSIRTIAKRIEQVFIDAASRN